MFPLLSGDEQYYCAREKFYSKAHPLAEFNSSSMNHIWCKRRNSQYSFGYALNLKFEHFLTSSRGLKINIIGQSVF